MKIKNKSKVMISFLLCALLILCAGCGNVGPKGGDGSPDDSILGGFDQADGQQRDQVDGQQGDRADGQQGDQADGQQGDQAGGQQEEEIDRRQEEDNVQQGEEADEEKIQMPDFEMTLLDGETMSFQECLGKKVLLNFWATWCGPCVGEMPAFQKLADEFSDELVILAVNCSEAQSTVQKFIQNKGYTFPIILDADGTIQAMFGGITSIPLTVIIDEEGYIVTASTGAADADTMYKAYKEALGL